MISGLAARRVPLRVAWAASIVLIASVPAFAVEPGSYWFGVSCGALYHSVEAVAFVRRDRTTEITPESVRAHYQILKVGKDPSDLFHDRARLNLAERPRKKYDEFGLLVAGVHGRPYFVGPFNEAQFDYMRNTPPYDIPEIERLPYYVPFVDSSDPAIARDALAQFVRDKAPAEAARLIPAEPLRRRLHDPRTSPHQFGICARLLSFQGNADDARVMERRIVEPVGKEEMRSGITGVLTGYLMIAGAKGLDLVDDKVLRDHQKNPYERRAVLRAIEFVTRQEKERIPRERLAESLVLMLDSPTVARDAIPLLADWKHWSLQDRVFEVFDVNDDSASIAIAAYLIRCAHDVPPAGPEPAHAAKAREHLARMRQKDPVSVRIAESRQTPTAARPVR